MNRRLATDLARATRLALLGAVLGMASPFAARANDLRIESGRVERLASGSLRLTAKVSWKNAWRTARNHDAAWLFVYRPRPAGSFLVRLDVEP